MEDEKRITLETDGGERIDLNVLEETRINGMNYILVTDAAGEDEDGQCYILKDRSAKDEADAVYEFVDDEDELDYLFRIFSELVADMDLDLEK